MDGIKKVGFENSTVVPTCTVCGLDIAKKEMIDRFLTYYVFDTEYGVGDYLQIPAEISFADFSERFSPHGARAIRIALNLNCDASQDEVKEALKEAVKSSSYVELPEEVKYESKLQIMPPGVTVRDLKDAEKELNPKFAQLFGLDETTTEAELTLAMQLALGIIQREKYG